MKEQTGLEIAIIGMAGRFPGASDVNKYWNNLRDGVESVSFFTDEELLRSGVDKHMINDPSYIKANSILEDKEYFDAAFFNYRPDEARLMDPQIRIFHECVWSALEDAGCNLTNPNIKAGLFAGSSANINWEVYAKLINRNGLVDDFAASQLSNTRFLATKVSYFLNMHGPSIYLDTACSTSLVAVNYACKSLLLGECNVGIAGGITITERAKNGYLYNENMINSRDGHCRTFDAAASGTVSGEGVGVVVLKTLKNALKDNDHIWAVIKGTAINNDGNNKVGYTAPSINGQAEVIRTAHKWARVSAESITYVEAHGTATKLGDPIEVEALNQAFGKSDEKYCALGSVKTNMGHLDAAAGIAGLIKTALALKHRQIPPSLHFTKANEAINFKDSPFYVNTKLQDWKNDVYPLRAGVSSFGIGGTNAHVVLEEAPEKVESAAGRAYQLLTLSGKTPEALNRNRKNLLDFLKQRGGDMLPDQENPLSDIAYTLQTGRQPMEYREAIVCRNNEDAIALLSAEGASSKEPVAIGRSQPLTVFMFPGQGSQYKGMCHDLYQQEIVFRAEVDKCFGIIEKQSGRDISDALFSEGKIDINDTANTQPALFVIEYALARLLMHWGIHPAMMIGHSIGEYVAACISGVFSLEDALRLVMKRGELMQKAKRGKMMAISIKEEILMPLLKDRADISLGAVNSSEQCVVAGNEESMISFEAQLRSGGYVCRDLTTSHAFHSYMMDDILEEFASEFKKVRAHSPQIPFMSNVSGVKAEDTEVTDPQYWVKHLRQTVRFSQGIENIFSLDERILFVEVGPGRALSSLVQSNLKKGQEHKVFTIVRKGGGSGDDLQHLLSGLGHLWVNGNIPDWKAFYEQEGRRKISLPSYSFEKTRYPVIVDAFKMLMDGSSLGSKADLSWLYVPGWKQMPLSATSKKGTSERSKLLFIDKGGIGENLAEKYLLTGETVVCVKAGTGFKRITDDLYEIDPGKEDDYHQLFESLAGNGGIPKKIIHSWSISSSTLPSSNLYFYSLLYIARSLSDIEKERERMLVLLTNDLYIITGDENMSPEKSVALGLLKVISQEYPTISTSHIDISFTGGNEAVNTSKLSAEIDNAQAGAVVCHRKSQRLVQIFDTIDPKTDKQDPVIRKKGVYLIAGGLGNLGSYIARCLLNEYDATVILLGRTALPSQKEWALQAQQEGIDDDIKKKIKVLQQLEAISAEGEVVYIQADISDSVAFKNVIKTVENRHGLICGVVHAAGVVNGKSFNLISTLDKGDFECQFTAKLKGLKVLKEVLHERELDFCLVTSSLSSILGGLSFASYASANTFIDHYISLYKERGELKNWISVNFDGCNFDETVTSTELINLPELWPVIEKLLSVKDLSQIVVSKTDLQRRLNDWINKKTFADGSLSENVMLTAAPMSTSEVAGDIEATMIALWKEFFGRSTIGLTDDFFQTGGDSLQALTMTGRIRKAFGVEIPMIVFFENATIKELVTYIRSTSPDSDGSDHGKEYSSIPISEKKAYYPLSPAQKRLYFLHHLDETSLAYNSQTLVWLNTDIDIKRMESAFLKLLMRHDSLRSVFDIVNNLPVQKAVDIVSFELKQCQAGQRDMHSLIKEFIQPFDVSKGPLLRVFLITVSKERHLLMIDLHHIIADGLSSVILMKEFTSLYNNETLPERKLQYHDYVVWLQDEVQQSQINQQKSFWLNQFSGEINILDLPTDLPRPLIKSYLGDSVAFVLNASETESLRAIAETQGATLFMVLLAAYNVLLSKLVNNEDIIVGTPVAGRGHADLESIIGMFVNTLPLRNCPNKHFSFTQFLEDVKVKTLEAFDNQFYPYEELLDELKIERNTGRNPLFDVLFSYINGRADNPGITHLVVEPFDSEIASAQFDLTLTVIELDESLKLNFKYATALFEEKTVLRFVGCFHQIVASIIKNPSILIGNIEIITAEEKAQVVDRFNNSALAYPTESSIISMFEEIAKTKRSAIALVFEGKGITYNELNAKSNQLARKILDRGMTKESIVGIMLRRSHEMIIGLLAVLKAGCAYMPIDPEYPIDRIQFMAGDSGMRLLLTEPALYDKYSQLLHAPQTLDITSKDIYEGSQENLPIVVPSSSLAYLIYTSGSTGHPKGVMIEHRSVVNFVYGVRSRIGLADRNAILCLTTISFDIFVLETILPLLSGITVIMGSSADQKDPVAIERLVHQQQVDLLQVTPSHLKLLLAAGNAQELLSGIKILMVGGEAFPDPLLKELKSKYKGHIYNMYGPTETTVWSAIQDLTHLTVATIGKPIANTTLRILDEQDNLQPIGVIGELCIGGDGLTRGYWKNESLTAEKIIRDPVKNTSRLYRTGDLVKWLTDGSIAYVGRTDDQIKLRGFRIELGEIESHLLLHGDITQVAVTKKEQGDDVYLVGYYVSANEIAVSDLRGHLSGSLPEYMIPAYFVHIESMPLTPNGKISRRALPDFQKIKTAGNILPENEWEQEISGIWREVLEMENIGTNVDFFSIGGNSIRLIQLFKLIDARYPKSVKVMDLFNNRTIADLAGFIKSRTDSDTIKEFDKRQTTIIDF